jgi:hypothetical protein
MKVLDWFKPRNWGWVKVYRDFENYADWVKTIKKEKADPESLYNKWKFQHTKLYDVYLIFSLDEVDLQLPPVVQRTKVIEYLNPVNRYFDEDLGFGECLNCEFNQFEDDQHNLTLTYLIVYSFNWNKFSLKWLLKFIIINTILLILILKLKLIPLLISWISSLI